MAHAQEEMKRASACGYWPLYRYHPERPEPFTLDSPAPALNYGTFLEGETRFSSLKRTFPERAEELASRAEREAERRYRRYERLARKEQHDGK